MKLAVYGGSFNPPHLGHVRAARAAMAFLKPDRFFLVPDRIPPHKTLEEGSPDAGERFALTQLAAAQIPGAQALDIELRRDGPSYTADTLRELIALYPGDELVLLMGSDMFLSLETWREPAAVMRLSRIGVFGRADGETSALEAMAAMLRQKYAARVDIIPLEPMEISSSRVRELLPLREGMRFLPEEVYARIIRKRLYGAKPSLAWLRTKAYTYLDEKRVPHVRGTELEAVRLAQRWGEDESDAAEAAILHDVTKRLSKTEQLQLCEKYGIMTESAERENEKLLHAKTGAALAADVFGAPPAIAAAIRWHTTGRAEMTRLEKIIYLADYIEPSRHGFAGLEELRAMAYTDLDGCMALGLQLSLEEVRAKGLAPHENTRKALAWFRRGAHD